ncbi:MAG: peptidylprolyl isomerase [Pseudomonadota bacterium]
MLMIRVTISRFFTITCASLVLGAVSFAQEAAKPDAEEVIRDSGLPREAVAAVVDRSVITTYDVRQRMKLMMVSSGGAIPKEAMGQLQTQAMRDLIDEKLKLTETKSYELIVSKDEINQELAMVAAQSNLTVPQMTQVLQSQGVSVGSLKQQVEANIAWPQLVQGRYRDRIRVNDDEVEQTLERMREDASLEQFLLSEICIPVADPAQAQQLYQGSLQLLEQMRRGVPFSVVAQQFSACTTAAVGGDLGWIRAGELPPELDDAVRALPAGSVTNPIPSEGAFMIMAVRDKREAVVAGEPTFTLAHAVADTSIGSNAARLALEKLSEADPCSGRMLRTDLGEGVGVTLLESMTLGMIDERFRAFIGDLERGEKSAVVEADGALHTALVCDKDDGLGLPSRTALENRIYNRQLSRISQQYLRDVERKSLVDIRLNEPLSIDG